MLALTLVQTDLYWENPTANRAMLEEHIFDLKGKTDLIVLPEMFATGFTMNSALHAEPMHLHSMKWMQQMAQQTQAVVVGSLAIKEKNQYFNRLIWMEPSGRFDCYDKRHLFRMGGENQVYTAGNQRLIKELKGFKIAPFICYDLRFPVWLCNKNLEYDLLLFVANWPAARTHVWQTLLKARAIENQAYCVGVNRIGLDGNGLPHEGHSMVVDYKGFPIFEAENEVSIQTILLEKQPLDDFRSKFPSYLDGDDFEIL